MSKSARPTLSTVLPAKGEATRPEPQPQMQKATAQPAASAEQPAPQPSAAAAIPQGRGKANRVVRVPVTVKIPEDVYKRLREAAFREEVDKQDLVAQGLDELLTRMNY